MKRLSLLALAAAAASAAPAAAPCTMPAARPPPGERRFVSASVEALLASYVPRFKDPNLGMLFANTLPNTLDTTGAAAAGGGSPAAARVRADAHARAATVLSHVPGPPADSFVITGDIPASWLRDSANQVWPYLRFVREDAALASLVAGVVRRSAANVLRCPYCNAFNADATKPGDHADDATKPDQSRNNWVFEAKYEVDSLANVLRLSSAYYNASGGDSAPFDAQWLQAVRLITSTFRAQQAGSREEDASGGPPYTFQRNTPQPSDSLLHGRGAPAARTGMLKSAFRASDDAVVCAFNIPENAFAAVALSAVAALLSQLGHAAEAAEAASLAADIRAGIAAHGVMAHPLTKRAVYAYEVDGFGNSYFMDDANIPSLLALPIFGWCSAADPLYAATRDAVLSGASNPYFMRGAAGEGIGGPHVGWPMIWPISVAARAWTAVSDAEIAAQLAMLVDSSACTGFIHESFDRDDASVYTRPWFAWANSFFADTILKIADERPHLIFK